MTGPEPSFMSSPFFVDEMDNWHLLPGAPEDVKKEFEEFMNSGLKPPKEETPDEKYLIKSGKLYKY